jgi:hypothetical protein
MIMPQSNRMSPRATRLVPAVLSVLLMAGTMTACGAPSGTDDGTAEPAPNQGIVAGALEVKVDRTARVLTLRNTTASEVGYMVLEKDMMTIALMPPCGNSCPILVQGASATVPYASIGGYTPQAKEGRVLWWSYKRNADGTRTTQGGVNTVSITL